MGLGKQMSSKQYGEKEKRLKKQRKKANREQGRTKVSKIKRKRENKKLEFLGGYSDALHVAPALAVRTHDAHAQRVFQPIEQAVQGYVGRGPRQVSCKMTSSSNSELKD